MKTKDYKALQWFRISVVIGFCLNLVFIIPGLFAPRFLEHRFSNQKPGLICC